MPIQTPNMILFFSLQITEIKNVANYSADKGVGKHITALH